MAKLAFEFSHKRAYLEFPIIVTFPFNAFSICSGANIWSLQFPISSPLTSDLISSTENDFINRFYMFC